MEGDHFESSRPTKRDKATEADNMIITIRDLKPAASNTVNTKFIILEKGKITIEGGRKTCLSLVADQSASVHFQMWENECDVFQPGDIVQLSKGVFSYHKSNLVLRAGRKGKAVKIGEFTMTFIELPNMSEIHWVRDPSDQNQLIQDPTMTCLPYSKLFPPAAN
eukprot:TRINITY_DN2518_c0_g1_i1.p1 TRINITY_DN2518_c0_g1~~TRINITY_DN2518_c0_g1_i1.p1  ORF type:complete len:164 (+),score=29.27 TRINITY_DN2518_c0_g1_i1:255-746(+)